MNKKIWQKITLVCFSLIFILFSAAQIQAGGLNDAFSKNTLAPVAGKGFNTETSLNQIIATIVQTILGLMGVIFMLLIVYGGVIWMTAEGEEAKVEKAQKILKNAIIGLIIVLSAYAISYFIINALSQKALT
jgi:hypothetical protein